jgi:hypothetical protein
LIYIDSTPGNQYAGWRPKRLKLLQKAPFSDYWVASSTITWFFLAGRVRPTSEWPSAAVDHSIFSKGLFAVCRFFL